MASGTVPIYVPPPDVYDYIPRDAFINYFDFKNLDELVDYLKSIVNTKKYEEYKQKGWEYVNSEKFRPFTVEQFAEDVYKAVEFCLNK